MEKRIDLIKASFVMMAILVILANGVDAQIYPCWGGCYNQCFPGTQGTQNQAISCYNQCANSCVPRTSQDFQYYCEIGCSFLRCVPIAYDGARLESCFGTCTNTCKSWRR